MSGLSVLQRCGEDRMNKLARLIAFYLPQYHPIPENDEWWGKGFTEWTHTAKAKPLFRGHYQPHVPADLGFYDLRVPETRIAQAEMAREYGIEAFCYYHYWFGTKQLLERPFKEVLDSGEPEFPFCICWANQTWTGIWHGVPDRVLIEQTYPGEEDHQSHFNYLLKAFLDKRYVTIDGLPIFLIYRPHELPDPLRVTAHWNEMAFKAGLKGLYFVGVTDDTNWVPQKDGFHASVIVRFPSNVGSKREPVKWLRYKYQKLRRLPSVFNHDKDMPRLRPGPAGVKSFPCVMPNWDNTPRSGSYGKVLHGSTPNIFRRELREAIQMGRTFPFDGNIVFIKSWNEWAEGNHLEPDHKFGRGYLEVVREEVFL
jgi:lipopolysaccharide biosynthesis protein